MKTIYIAALMIMALSLCLPAQASWEIKFGKADSEVGYVNPPPGPEDFPLGPHSFRIINDELWLADSVKGRLLSFSKKGKLNNSVSIPGFNQGAFIDDFAAQIKDGNIEAFWACERFGNELVRFSPSGKELARVKNTGLVQLDQLAADSSGQLYVGDYGKGMLAVFSSDGQKIREMKWQMSGFAVDSSDRLHTISYDDSTGHLHLIFDNSGKEVGRNVIGFKDMQNPRLWQVSKNNDIFVSFLPQSGDPSKNVLVTITEKGLILKKINYTNPYYIGRYLMVDDKDCWVVKTDFLKAPKGSIKIQKTGSIK